MAHTAVSDCRIEETERRERERGGKLLDEDENFDFLMLFQGRCVLNVIDLL